MMPLRRDPKMVTDPTPEEQKYLEELTTWLKEGTGYQWIQGTRPQTLAFALTDSPAGLAAWIIEKFRAWSDCGGDLELVFTKDELLANISLYWFTGAIGSSFWPYYARLHRPWPVPDHGAITVPTGYCEFPREILHPPKSLAARTYTDIRRWTVMPRGGHFAAMEQPEALAAEIFASFSGRFARGVRAGANYSFLATPRAVPKRSRTRPLKEISLYWSGNPFTGAPLPPSPSRAPRNRQGMGGEHHSWDHSDPIRNVGPQPSPGARLHLLRRALNRRGGPSYRAVGISYHLFHIVGASGASRQIESQGGIPVRASM